MTFPITKYPGNKATAGYYQKIISLMPPHTIYVEPCLGSGGIMRKKEPVQLNIGCDLNKDIINNTTAPHAGNYNFYEMDCREILTRWQHKDPNVGKALFFIDLPYMQHTRRSSKSIYKHESTLKLHTDVLHIIKNYKHYVMMCGYDNKLYNTELATWNKIEIKRSVHGNPATEIVWYNFPAPKEIQQYDFLGDNRTDRQRIKRKVSRWVNNFSNLPVLEQSLIYKELSKKKLLQ